MSGTSNFSRMGGVRRYEFRANSSCLERTQLSGKKDSDSLSRRRRPDRSWQFLQRSKRSMRIFHRSTILRQSRSIFDDAPVDAIYGVIRADLEQIGQPIGAHDLLIAAHALALDLTVVTDNEREFLRIEDVRVENWLRQGRSDL